MYVFASLALFLAALVLRVGIGLTPYETTDSMGRTMGFNDPLSTEHYLIMVRNFHVRGLLDFEYAYAWLLLAMHGLGVWLLWSPRWSSARVTRWFFALQALVFPLGVALILYPPLFIAAFFHGPLDRESFVDLPFIAMLSHPVWVVVSLMIMLRMHGPGLGLARVWQALKRGTRSGAQTFAEALR